MKGDLSNTEIFWEILITCFGIYCFLHLLVGR